MMVKLKNCHCDLPTAQSLGFRVEIVARIVGVIFPELVAHIEEFGSKWDLQFQRCSDQLLELKEDQQGSPCSHHRSHYGLAFSRSETTVPKNSSCT